MDPLTQVKLGKNFAALVGLGCISKQTMHSTMKITRLNSSKDNFLMKSFPSSTKRELSILLNFLFLFNSVFLTLKCRTLGLIPPHGDRMVAILLKMDILHLKVGVLNASHTFQPLMSFWYWADIIISILKSLVIPAICLALSSHFASFMF